MGKTRMTAVDLRAAASELSHRLVGLRLQNIYDINPRTYLLKFGAAGREQKDFVLLEVGTRLHATTFSYDKPKVPSGFTLKLRKHIRQWRLDSLRQLGVDRVVDFCFGSEERSYHLLVEFYAKGNLILTDHEYNILALVRTFSSEDARYAVRAKYPMHELQMFRPITPERLLSCFSQCEEEASQSLKQHITNVSDYGPAFVEHCLLTAGLKPNAKKAAAAAAGRQALDSLVSAFEEADAFLRDVPQPQGFLVRRRKEGSAQPTAAAAGAAPAAAAAAPAEGTPTADAPVAAAAAPAAACVDSSDDELLAEKPKKAEQPAAQIRPSSPFDDFAPVRFLQHQKADLDVQTFDTFNAACDCYFSALDQASIEKHNVVAEKQKETKLDKAKRDHQRRLDELGAAQAKNERFARLIEENAETVEQAIAIVRGAVAQGVSWEELARLIKEQKRVGHPVAAIIHRLNLQHNRVALLLTHVVDHYDSSAEEEEEEEDDSQPAEVVEVDIGLSAFANARLYFETRRKAQQKQHKTEAAGGKAMKQAARKAERTAKRQENAPKKEISQLRRTLWFEKFNWFVTSDNLLCIAGRDAQQNEILVRRYLRRGDLYVHAEIHGAATCILKNPSGAAVPLRSLCEAGTMTVCRSSAWDAHIVIGAWWVYHHQVSKTAPSGEYLPTGSFMVRGKKNFLPPSRLQMGVALLFRVHEDHVCRHKGERSAEGDAAAPADARHSDPAFTPDSPACEPAPAPDVEEAAVDAEPEEAAADAEPKEEPKGAQADAEEEADANAEAEAEAEADADAEAGEQRRPKAGGGGASVLSRYGLHSGAYAEDGAAAVGEEPDDAGAGSEREDAGLGDGGRREAEQQKRKGISAKDRRQMRKARAAAAVAKMEGGETTAAKPEPPQPKLKAAPKGEPQKELTRAERRKKKKLARYDDQSDDERELRMQLCGHFGGQKALLAAMQQQQHQQKREEPDGASEAAAAVAAFDDDAFAKDTHKKGPREEGEITMQTDILDALTAVPREDDLVLHGIAVCAPWDVVKGYRYKASVFPGKEKKGKASAAALHFFGKQAAEDQERDCIRRLDPQELITVLPSNIRLEMGEADKKAKQADPRKGKKK